jgi:hypothetical protein
MKKNLNIIPSFFILLFLYAALSKLEAYATFAFQLSKSPFITRYAAVVAWSLPLGEILTALALLIPFTRLTGLFSSLFLMSMFTAYIFAITHFSYYIPCSCGGILSEMSWTVHFYFNIACILLSMAGIFLYGADKRAKARMKSRWIFTALNLVLPVFIIYILYSSAYQPNKEDNGFTRNYSSLTVMPVDTLQARSEYGQICGVTPSHFYIELVGRKNQVLQLGWDLKNGRYYSFRIPNDKKMLSRLNYQIDSPGVNIFAGNGPDVFKADLDSAGKLLQHHYPYPLFLRGFALSNGQYLFRGFDSVGVSIQIPFIRWDPASNMQVRKFNPFPSAPAMGLESDGIMNFDTTTRQIAFIPYYKNGILVLDSDFQLKPVIKTIDTVLHGRTSAGAYQEDGNLQFSNNTPQFFVNGNTDTHGGLVYINSLLRADNENRNDFETYSDIDVYSLKTYKYLYSMKIPRLNKRRFISFKILDDKAVACYPDGIVAYRLSNNNLVITKGGS